MNTMLMLETCGVTLPTTYQIIFAKSRANFCMMNGLMLEFIQKKYSKVS